MLVRELVEKLQTKNPDGRVFMGYDGNIVVTEPASVEQITLEDEAGDCWFRVHTGDVVILCDE